MKSRRAAPTPHAGEVTRMKENCWEFKNCGLESGGAEASEMGVCAAYKESRLNGVHGGTNGGRSCWVVAGTSCNNMSQGGYSEKIPGCRECEFFMRVNLQEGENALKTITMLSMLG